MIVTKLKPLEEIYEMIKPYKNVLIVGCDGCCQPPRGFQEAVNLGNLLKLKNMVNGKEFSFKATTVLRQCDDKIAANALRSLVGDFDALLSMSCGIGVQMLTHIFPEKITFPAQNSMFNGSADHERNAYLEMCNQCGNCLLGVTGGVCPVAGCAKSLMNGPCGGQIDGLCEVGNYTEKCAWVEIYKRLKRINRLDLFEVYREKRDYRLMTSPNIQDFYELEEIEDEIAAGTSEQEIGDIKKEKKPGKKEEKKEEVVLHG